MALIDFKRIQEICQITMGNSIRTKDEDGDLICMRDPYKKCIPEECHRIKGRFQKKENQKYEYYTKKVNEELYREMNRLQTVLYDKVRDLLLNSKDSKEMNDYIRVIHSAVFDSLTEWDAKDCKTQTRS